MATKSFKFNSQSSSVHFLQRENSQSVSDFQPEAANCSLANSEFHESYPCGCWHSVVQRKTEVNIFVSNAINAIPTFLLRAIFNVGMKVMRDLLNFALWLVQKLAQSSQPIRYKASKNRASVIRVFPRFRQFGQFACFHSEFSLANDNMNLCSDWSLRLLGFWFFNSQFLL